MLLFISFSGRTPELINLISHLPPDLSVIAMTSHLKATECPLLREHNGILLPTPLHEPEEVSFGICAPTTSTTVQMAIGDMIALTVGERLHLDQKSQVFKKNHPGGAIGAVTKAEARAEANVALMSPFAVTPLELPSPTISASSG